MKSRLGLWLLVVVVIAALLPAPGRTGDGPTEQRGTGPALTGGAPMLVSYQGQVLVSSAPYSGVGSFKFAVVDQWGTTTFWSNDGSSLDGAEPTAAVTLTVSGGLFNVLLGDDSLANMTELPPIVFEGAARWLRVWFSSNGTTFTLLAPDRRIAAVPYALQAQEAANAVTLEGLPGGAYQQRVNGGCAVGSVIRAVNPDGTVVCELDAPLRRSAPPADNAITTVDATGWVGVYTSITIGADGLPVVSYYDTTNQDLKVLHCGNAACSSENTMTTVDSVGDVGEYTSITIGADGLPVVSYYDDSNDDLKVLHCGDVACASGNTTTTLDASGIVGLHTSIAIGADGLPVISYYDESNANLKVAHCGNAACTAGNTLRTLDSFGSVGEFTSIAMDAAGLPLVAYYDAANSYLKVSRCGDAACTTVMSAIVVAVGVAGNSTAIAIGADRLPVLSYFDTANGDLNVVHCGDIVCYGGNTTSAVDATGSVGQYTSLTIGADGLPVISYDDWEDNLNVLRCGNAACSAGNTITRADWMQVVGEYSAITIGVDGLPVVSYWDTTNYDLKILHCANVFCTPYWRRR